MMENNVIQMGQQVNRTYRPRRILPAKAFDSEYMTEWLREVRWLEERGFKPDYVRTTKEYGIQQYKYKKTPELFSALTEFYTEVQKDRANIASDDEVEKALKSAGLTMRKSRNGRISFVKDAETADDTE